MADTKGSNPVTTRGNTVAMSAERLNDKGILSETALREAQRPFREIFDENADRVWRTLRRLGVSESSADDALQDVFLIVHQKLDQFEGRAQLSTWIYAVAYRVAQNYRRRRQKDSHEELSETVHCPSLSPQGVLAEGEAARFVQKFCQGLDEKHRDVFVLCVLESQSAPQAARLLGVKLNTVYSRVRSTRALFREALVEFQARGGAEG